MSPHLTAYITAQTITHELDRESSWPQAATLLKQARFSRVLLESYRGGCLVSSERLATLRDYFLSEGFEVLGGLMPEFGPGFGKLSEGAETRNTFFCYSDSETVRFLEAEIRKLSGLFSNIVIDDAFLTSCRCAECTARRGHQDWAAFRRDLLVRVAEGWVHAARDVRADVRLILKLPQCYDRAHLFGCDVERFPKVFDALYTSTETRNPTTFDFGYVEPYEAYFNALWGCQAAGGQLEGGWFDYLDCDDQLFYEQALTTALVAPRDIVVFCYDRAVFSGSKLRRLAEAGPMMTDLAAIAQEPYGVHVIKPPNADPGRDHYLFDYLGMMGVPCVPAQHIETSMRSIFVPAHAANDRATRDAIVRALVSGRQVCVSFHALERMADDAEMLALFGYKPHDVAQGRSHVAAFECGEKTYPLHAPFHVAGDLRPSDAAVLAWAHLEKGATLLRVPLVSAKTFASGGRAVVWNVETFGKCAFDVRERLNVPIQPEWFHLPKPVLDVMRRSLLAPLGIDIHAPARVTVFLFAKHAAFANYNTAPAEVQIGGITCPPETLRADSPKTALSGGRLFLAPRSFAFAEVQRPV